MEHSRSSWEWENEPGQQQVRVGSCLGTHSTAMSPRNGSCSSQHEKDTSSERFQPSSPHCKQLHGLCCKHCKPAQREGPGQHVAVCLALVVTSEWHTHAHAQTDGQFQFIFSPYVLPPIGLSWNRILAFISRSWIIFSKYPLIYLFEMYS